MIDNKKNIQTALRSFAAGQMLLVTDDDGRENEGDLVIAAQHCTEEVMAFLLRHTSGIICTPMPKSQAKRLGLAPMVHENDSAHTTAFTVSVDYKHETSTGISAHDRALTARKLIEPGVCGEDFCRPGHVFPLIAREGGVLVRAGHTEAAVDLCVLAGLFPVAVIGELTNDDGTVKKGAQLTNFAQEHGLSFITISDLIAYRQSQETLIVRLEERFIKTFAGPAKVFIYKEKDFLRASPYQASGPHMAFLFGEPGMLDCLQCYENVKNQSFA